MVQKLLVESIDPGASLEKYQWHDKRLKTKSGIICISLASDRSAHHHDSNGANDTQIRVQMTKLEQVKV